MSVPELHALSPERILEIFASVTPGTRYDPFMADIVVHHVAEDGAEHNGQTGFFRHGMALNMIFRSLQSQNRNVSTPFRILIPGDSFGAGALSTAALAIATKLGGNAGFIIDAFDRSALFTAIGPA